MARYSLACAAALAVFMSGSALAQVAPSLAQADGPALATGSDATPVPGADQAPLPVADPAPVAAKKAPANTGPFAALGTKLAEDGIKFRGLLTNEFAANPIGGVRQSNRNVGQVYLGTDLDLDKLIGIKGAKFHFTLYHDYGHGLAKDVTGTFFKQQDIYKNEFPRLHFGLFSYEQDLFDRKLNIIVGRLGTTAFYGHLAPNCFFQAGVTCGIPAVLNSEAGFGLLPSATWGGNVKYRATKKLYVETGIFEVNPFTAQTNGLDFSTTHATGFTVPFEVGYDNSNFKTAVYPSEWKVGGYISTGNRNDPFFNAKGQSAGLTGTAQRVSDILRSGIYVMGDKTIWRPDPSSTRSLTVFGGWIQPLERDEVIDRQIYSGLLLRGLIKGRPRDSIGLTAAWFHVSPKEIAFLRDSRIHAKGSGVNDSNEFAFELNYGFDLARAIRVTPNVQYVINPDNSQFPKIAFVPKNLLTFGVKLTVNITDLLGFPSQVADD